MQRKRDGRGRQQAEPVSGWDAVYLAEQCAIFLDHQSWGESESGRVWLAGVMRKLAMGKQVSYRELYKQRLSWHLTEKNWSRLGTASLTAKPSSFLEPSDLNGTNALVPMTTFDHSSKGAAACAIGYFLGDAIKPQLVALVAELAPWAKAGMPQAVRNKKLAAINDELTKLQKDRDGLIAELDAARNAANIPEAGDSYVQSQ